MHKTYNVLIIEDHQLLIDVYKSAIILAIKDMKGINLNIDEAKDCDTAYEKIKNTEKGEALDLVFLDVSLPPSSDRKILSGEDLGKIIRKRLPGTKIIVSTLFDDSFRINNIFKSVNPEGFLIKGDIDLEAIIKAFKTVMNGETYYCKTIIDLLRNYISSPFILDSIDFQIINEIGNNASMKELERIIPLSRRGIEQRKNKLKDLFNIKSNSDRDLILEARRRGFV